MDQTQVGLFAKNAMIVFSTLRASCGAVDIIGNGGIWSVTNVFWGNVGLGSVPK
jgi:hypothetical protein